jgi:hypothetical protein
MKEILLSDLQATVQDKSGFTSLEHYLLFCETFLEFVKREKLKFIISPTNHNYFFYQYDKKEYDYKITRPLNEDLFEDSVSDFKEAFERFAAFLLDLKRYQESAAEREGAKQYLESEEINGVIYTIQQSLGCIGDSFSNPNQSRKRVGQLFEALVKLIIKEVGLECESRTIKLPVPGYSGYTMSYDIDLVFSRNKAILTSETKFLHPTEVIGSVKTTSKDRIDKIFLDKYMLNKLLGRDIPVIAIFLHDVQRAKKGNSIFGINSTFKSNHFLGYTVALNKLDGVYYVARNPNMIADPRLNAEISDFQEFLVKDLWKLAK